MLSVSSPGLKTDNTFSTDSNGYFEMTRSVSGSYENKVYPVSSFIKMESKKTNKGIAIFPDRAEGGTVERIGIFNKEEESILLHIQRSARGKRMTLEAILPTGEVELLTLCHRPEPLEVRTAAVLALGAYDQESIVARAFVLLILEMNSKFQ